MSSSMGGSAAASGINFEAELAAWAAVGVLAQQAVTPLWTLPPDVHYVQLRCQSGEPVDDLLIGTSAGGFAFVQAKRRLDCSPRRTTDFAKALDQCVRQFQQHRSQRGHQPWQRPLEAELDRLVIATAARTAPASIARDVPRMLKRFRENRSCATLRDAAPTQQLSRFAETMERHVEQSWRAATGRAPSVDELRPFWEILRFSCFDLEEDGVHRMQALDTLRRDVLRAPTHAEAVFSLLLAHCARLAADPSGATRDDLVALLHRQPEPFHVLGPPSFRADLQRLKNLTDRSLASLQRCAEIRCGEHCVRIERVQLRALIEAAGESGDFLITGEPGVGKTGAECRFVESLRAAHRDVVLLNVDQIEASSLGSLREELGLEHDLVDVLQAWTGEHGAFLILEALDAARSAPGIRLYQDLIAEVQRTAPRWVVAASIREFDLRWSDRYRELFRGQPIDPTLAAEFPRVRAVRVPCLTDEELAVVADQAPPLGRLLTMARLEDNAALLALLRRPFELRLAAELAAAGTATDELARVLSGVDLLDRYWSCRVLGEDRSGRARDAVCRRLADQMAAGRELHAAVAGLPPGDETALHELLGSGVLVEWRSGPTAQPSSQVVAFGHNIIFDYAVARTLLDLAAGDLRQRIARDPTSVLALHPSFTLQFERLWWRDSTRQTFFEAALALQHETVPRIGQLFGPSVAAMLGRRLSDFKPLLTGLEDVLRRDQSEVAAGLVVGGLLAAEVRLVGSDSLPWCELARELARRVSPRTAWPVRSLLAVLSEACEAMTPRERSNTLSAAAALFDFAWQRFPAWRDGLLPVTVKILCRLSDTAPGISEPRLRSLMGAANIDPGIGGGLFHLASEIDSLFRSAPQFAADFYRHCFEADDPPETPVAIWDSQILALATNLRDQFRSTQRRLGQSFAEFLAAAPQHALEALDGTLRGWRAQGHNESATGAFSFRGRGTALEEDHSAIWDGTDDAYEPPKAMLNAFSERVIALASAPSEAELEAILDALAARPRRAAIWRRLLRAGAERPDPLGLQLVSAAVAEPLLRSTSTRRFAFRCLDAVYPLLPASERERLEDGIAALSSRGSPPSYESIEEVRDRLLRRLSRHGLVSRRAIAITESLPTSESVDDEEDERRLRPRDLSPEEMAEWRASLLGIDLQNPVNAEFVEALAPMRALASQYLNSIPREGELDAVCSALTAFNAGIARAGETGVQTDLVTEGQGIVARLAGRVAACAGLGEGAPCFELAQRILVAASLHAAPQPQPDEDAQFDERSGRGCLPRTEAAEGLLRLCSRHNPGTNVLAAIRRLIADPSTAVRCVVAEQIGALRGLAPETFWSLLDVFVADEPNRTVAQQIVDALDDLPPEFDDFAVERAARILQRFAESVELQKDYGHLCLRRYVRSAHPQATAHLLGLAESPVEQGDVLRFLVLQLRDELSWRPRSADASRSERAWRLAALIAARGSQAWHGLLAESESFRQRNPSEPWPDALSNSMRMVQGVLKGLATELYFASGAHDDERPVAAASDGDRTARELFLERALPLIRQLGETGIAAATHELVRTLAAYRAIDPRQVFVEIGALVASAERHGYQYESIAAEVLEKLVRQYFADYAHLLRSDPQCQEALLTVLNVFVGWPAMARLTFRLGDVLR